MVEVATSPDPCACTTCAATAAGARQTRMLEELSDIAMDLARAPGSPYGGWPYADAAAQVVAAHGGMPPDPPDEVHPPP